MGRAGRFALEEYQKAGRIWWNEEEQGFCGRAADGKEVFFGDGISKDTSVRFMESYLENHLTPDEW